MLLFRHYANSRKECCRYIQLWEGWGHDTIWIRPPTSAIALPPLGDAVASQFSKQLLDLNKASPADQRTVIHIFR